MPESSRHHLNAVDVVSLGLKPHIVGREVPSEENVVQARLAGHDLLQGGVQGPGGQVAGVLPPVISPRPSLLLLLLAGGQSEETTDGIAALDWGSNTVVQLQVEVGEMEDTAHWDRAGGQGRGLVGRNVVQVSDIQPPVGLS